MAITLKPIALFTLIGLVVIFCLGGCENKDYDPVADRPGSTPGAPQNSERR